MGVARRFTARHENLSERGVASGAAPALSLPLRPTRGRYTAALRVRDLCGSFILRSTRLRVCPAMAARRNQDALGLPPLLSRGQQFRSIAEKVHVPLADEELLSTSTQQPNVTTLQQSSPLHPQKDTPDFVEGEHSPVGLPSCCLFGHETRWPAGSRLLDLARARNKVRREVSRGVLVRAPSGEEEKVNAGTRGPRSNDGSLPTCAR